MTETRTLHDPFIGQDVEISDKLVDRLRGRYANGPTMPNGEPEFGWQQYPTSSIMIEAAAEIERLRAALDTIAGMCMGNCGIGKIHATAVAALAQPLGRKE